jgi:hypothetical protein
MNQRVYLFRELLILIETMMNLDESSERASESLNIQIEYSVEIPPIINGEQKYWLIVRTWMK